MQTFYPVLSYDKAETELLMQEKEIPDDAFYYLKVCSSLLLNHAQVHERYELGKASKCAMEM
jgi:hypothetical protein